MTFAGRYGGQSVTDRREFMHRVMASAAAGALGVSRLAAAAAASSAAVVQATRLADDLLVFSGAGGNVVTLGNAASGLLMIDTGAAEFTGALLDAVQRETGTARVVTALNTHWH